MWVIQGNVFCWGVGWGLFVLFVLFVLFCFLSFCRHSARPSSSSSSESGGRVSRGTGPGEVASNSAHSAQQPALHSRTTRLVVPLRSPNQPSSSLGRSLVEEAGGGGLGILRRTAGAAKALRHCSRCLMRSCRESSLKISGGTKDEEGASCELHRCSSASAASSFLATSASFLQ